MAIQTTVWIPPSLCGCQLKVTADFLDGSVIDGASYRHPKPFTISDIEIVNVCDTHQPQTLSMPDTGGLFGIDNITGLSVQQRGYLSYPISSPTPAQCLYTFLAQYGGQKHGYSCGCSAHQWVDEKGGITYLPHPHHTRKCFRHSHDTVDMKQAAIDFNLAQAAALGDSTIAISNGG